MKNNKYLQPIYFIRTNKFKKREIIENASHVTLTN